MPGIAAKPDYLVKGDTIEPGVQGSLHGDRIHRPSPAHAKPYVGKLLPQGSHLIGVRPSGVEKIKLDGLVMQKERDEPHGMYIAQISIDPG